MGYMETVQKHRDDKDFQFKNHPHSPLTPQQKLVFKKLNYFPINEKFRFKVKIEEFEDKKEFVMQTNTGDKQHYIDFGKVSFMVDGEKAELHVYKTDKDPNYYFVPFWDQTVLTKETYGAGRYLELEPDPEDPDFFILDFNLAYNPFCAYNDRFSCPLTPPTNRLKVRIEAGEKVFKL
jgi:uncharacterized protein (DUF1684 family)